MPINTIWIDFLKLKNLITIYSFLNNQNLKYRQRQLTGGYKIRSGDTTTAKNAKRVDTPATCALCGGNHSANYRRCEHYHNALKESNTHRNITQRTHTNTNDNHMQPSGNLQQPRSHVEVTRSSTNQVEDTANILTKLIDEFKGLFNQLLQQNSMILNMLTMLINKNN
jgi:hypothetical protein